MHPRMCPSVISLAFYQCSAMCSEVFGVSPASSEGLGGRDGGHAYWLHQETMKGKVQAF